MLYIDHIKTLVFLIFIGALMTVSCKQVNQEESPTTTDTYENSASDERAVELAKQVLLTNGGLENWEATPYIAWTFFNSRRLLWDKQNRRARIQSLRDDYQAIINLADTTGQVYFRGEQLTHPDSLSKYLNRAYRIWINDSYWLVMPFKLLDPGVTLKYIGADTLENGLIAEVIELTFENVGVTPDNKYHVWIDSETNFIVQWAFFTNYKDSEPRFSNRWADYQRYGQIYLSGDRGENRTLEDIKVLDNVPNKVFESLDNYSF